MKDELPRYTLRISKMLLYKVEYIALFDGRSKNKEIEWILRNYVDEFEQKHGEIKWNNSNRKF